MAYTFTWVPDIGARKTTTSRTKVIKFGDGYEQRFSDSINKTYEAWDLTFTRTTGVIQQIDAFITLMAGTTSFYWTTPESKTLVFKADPEVSVTYTDSEYQQLTVKFTQVFERP